MERVVPTGHVFIIFELDGFERNTFDNNTLKPNGVFTNVWVSGNHKDYLSISAHSHSEMFVIQLKPEGFYPILHHPVLEFNNQVIPAEEVFGPDILALRATILSKEGALDKFKSAEKWLLDRIDGNKTPNEDLIDVLQQLKTKPMVNHQKIVAAYPKTQKHLINQFKKHFGLTPKVLHRIYRFNEILQEIHTNKRISWSQITYQFGYTDQSHFIKEFNEFSGFNPQEFIASDLHKERTNFFPLESEG